MLEVLRVQSGATRRFIRDTGVVFDSLTARSGQLRNLISNSNRVWESIAEPRPAAGGDLPGPADLPARGPRDDRAG